MYAISNPVPQRFATLWRGADAPARGLSDAARAFLSDNAFLRICVPVEVAGTGVSSLKTVAQLLRPIAEADPALAFIATHHLLMTLLLGNQWRSAPDGAVRDHIAKVLSSISAKGELLIAPVSENGNHFLAPRSAFLSKSGDRLLLCGSKPRASGAHLASWIYTSASDGSDRVNLLLPRDLISFGEEIHYDGWLSQTMTHQIRFNDVPIDPHFIISRKPLGAWSTSSLLGATAFTLLFTSNALALARSAMRLFPDLFPETVTSKATSLVDQQLLRISPALGGMWSGDLPPREPFSEVAARRSFAEALLLKRSVAETLSAYGRTLVTLPSNPTAQRISAELRALEVLGPLSREASAAFISEAQHQFPDLSPPAQLT